MPLRRERGSEEGQSLVELALLLPVLLLIMAGVLDIGRAFHVQIALINAAREGVRYGALHPEDCSAIHNRVKQEANGVGIAIGADDVGVCNDAPCPPQQDCNVAIQSGLPISVSVVYRFELLTGVVRDPISGSKTLSIHASSSAVQY